MFSTTMMLPLLACEAGACGGYVPEKLFAEGERP